MTDFSLSIIIPAYNEAGCIAESLAEVMSFAATHPIVREVIVVDDGSTDDTVAAVESAIDRHRDHVASLRLVRHSKNQGKGTAVRSGVLHAAGEVVLFMDADLSTPIDEVPRLLDPIRRGDFDIVIGSRAMDRSLIGVRQSWFRETAGRLFNVLVRRVTGLPIVDTQCGFKAFRLGPILPVFEIQLIGTFAFDVEVLYLARKVGMRIQEMPVHWNHVSHTKINLLHDSIQMFMDVLKIRFNDMSGRYRRLHNLSGTNEFASS